MSLKNLKIIETKDIPNKAGYLECNKCNGKANRFDLYCLGKQIHLQCVLCNSTYQLIDKEVVKAKKINIRKIINKKKRR